MKYHNLYNQFSIYSNDKYFNVHFYVRVYLLSPNCS